MSTHEDETTALPAGWRKVRLGNVMLEAQAGFATSQRAESGVIQLRMNNVTTRGTFDWSSFIRVPAEETGIQRCMLRPGDVLFNNTNSTELVGKSALFTGYDEPVVFSNHFTRLRSDRAALYPAFLSLWLQEQWSKGFFAAICNRWVGQSAVQRDKLLALEIPLPPLDEQRYIADTLAAQMAAVARARAAAAAQLAAAKILPDVYLNALLASEDSDDWPRYRFGDVASITARQVDPKAPEYGTLSHVNGENIEKGTARLVNVRTASEDGMTSGKYLFEQGDILYSKIRPYLRKVTLAPYRGVCSADIYPLRVDEERVYPSFAMWSLLSPEFTAYAEEESRRARMPKLNREQLFAWKIALPPLEVQRELVTKMKSQMQTVSTLQYGIADQLAFIGDLPKSLLSEAFSGALSARRITSFVWTPERVAVFMGWTTHHLHRAPSFGDTFQQKLFALANTHLRIGKPIAMHRAQYGPFHTIVYDGRREGLNQGWFTTTHRTSSPGVTYAPGANIREPLEQVPMLLGDREGEMRRILEFFAPLNADGAEAVATLYMAWNDLLHEGVQPTDDAIMQAIWEWHPTKRAKFPPHVLAYWLHRMREEDLVPHGGGAHTEA